MRIIKKSSALPTLFDDGTHGQSCSPVSLFFFGFFFGIQGRQIFRRKETAGKQSNGDQTSDE